MCVCVFVCIYTPFVHDSNHNFLCNLPRIWYTGKTCDNKDGQVPRVSGIMAPFYTKNRFWENLQLTPMDSVSAYFLTTDKAIITKLNQNIKEIELYTIFKIGDKMSVA